MDLPSKVINNLVQSSVGSLESGLLSSDPALPSSPEKAEEKMPQGGHLAVGRLDLSKATAKKSMDEGAARDK